MSENTKYIVGTSGYSFADWVGRFYPPETKSRDMFAHYVRDFETVELNFTFYRIPSVTTLAALDRKSPAGFSFWVKGNQQITHERDRSVVREFLDNLAPLSESGKLAGVLLQFPQSFHRTVENRSFLGEVVEDFASVPLAVEFRHFSWDSESTLAGLRDRNVALVVPDAPEIRGLFRPAPAVTSSIGYLRLHSRNTDKWYAGPTERYDYDYSDRELSDVLKQWSPLTEQVDKVFAFFNNCHHAQAAQNALSFQKLIAQME